MAGPRPNSQHLIVTDRHPTVLFHPQSTGTSARLRGLCAVSRMVCWASGSHDTVLRTMDGGASWQPRPVAGAEESDFRDVKAFDAENACVLAVGEGEKSRIYRTADGGASWSTAYANHDTQGFLDAIAFWDRRRGLALGDPVGGRFVILATEDGGATWRSLPPAGMPPALPGEGAFAASGTSLAVQGSLHAWFVTGGAAARVFRSADGGHTWQAAPTPIHCASPMAGLSSLIFLDGQRGVAVGGDYKDPSERADNVVVTTDGGAAWLAAREPPSGYRSCVARMAGGALVAVGLGGADVSWDGGQTWAPLQCPGCDAVSFAGAAGWASGEGGRMARVEKERR